MTNTTRVYETLTPIQREHLISLLGKVETPELKAAVEIIFWQGIHDMNGLRMIVQDDIHQFTVGVNGELKALRSAVGQLDNGLSIAEQIAGITAEREVLPAVQGLRDDIAHLVEIIGKPTEQDPRPLMVRQIDAEREIAQVKVQVSWIAPIAAVAAVALVLAAAAIIALLLEPATVLSLAPAIRP